MKKPNYYLIYAKNDERLDGENFTNKEAAEKRAKELSINAHATYPDVVDEEGNIFIMDWEGYSKPWMNDKSHSEQFIQVWEEEEEEVEE